MGKPLNIRVANPVVLDESILCCSYARVGLDSGRRVLGLPLIEMSRCLVGITTVHSPNRKHKPPGSLFVSRFCTPFPTAGIPTTTEAKRNLKEIRYRRNGKVSSEFQTGLQLPREMINYHPTGRMESQLWCNCKFTLITGTAGTIQSGLTGN